jgi:hypothetical protein
VVGGTESRRRDEGEEEEEEEEEGKKEEGIPVSKLTAPNLEKKSSLL